MPNLVISHCEPGQIRREITVANQFVDDAEDLIIRKGQIPAGCREQLLMAYWSLVFEFHRGILTLADHKFYAPCFALLRPIIESVVRAHVVLSASPESGILKAIRTDAYRTNLSTVGKKIDKALGLDGSFEDFLNVMKGPLHSYTHAGAFQLGRRFDSTGALVANYTETEVIEVIHLSARCVFMVNNLAMKHLDFKDEWSKNLQLFAEWQKHARSTLANDLPPTPQH